MPNTPPPPLPPDLPQRVEDLLLPHVRGVAERDYLFTNAFFIRDRQLFYEFNYEGTPPQFVMRCVRELLEKDVAYPEWSDHAGTPDVDRPSSADRAATPRRSALAVLLGALDEGTIGLEQRARRDDLVRLLDAHFALQVTPPAAAPGTGLGARPPTVDAPPPAPTRAPPPHTGPPLTIAVAPEDRQPAVFVSYSHTDAAIAARLVADLQQAGYACWIDTTAIKGGDEWVRVINEGLNTSYAMVSLLSAAANQSRWVLKEFLCAEEKGKLIIPVRVEACERPLYAVDYQTIDLFADYQDGLNRLLQSLPRPTRPTTTATPTVGPRALELEYLDLLPFIQQSEIEKNFDLTRAEAAATEIERRYVPLPGTAHLAPERTRQPDVHWLVMRPEFELLTQRPNHRSEPDTAEPTAYDDVLEAMVARRRAVVLGEPGAGKTTALLRFAVHLRQQAIANDAAPIPLFVRLAYWTDPTQPLTDFIRQRLGYLGRHVDQLLASGRAALLLDGLNETPVADREAKATQVKALFDAHPALITLVTCREQDYTLDLGFDRLRIRPLAPRRILAFAQSYLAEDGDDFFWQLAGGEAVRKVWASWAPLASLDTFITANEIPEDVHRKTVGVEDQVWREQVRDARPRSLVTLAANPYMLAMLLHVYLDRGRQVPQNRADLFGQFVATLLARQKADPQEARELTSALAKLAFTMQQSAGPQAADSALTVLPAAEVAPFLTSDQLRLAASASLVQVDDNVRFTHQLLQEYFAALELLRHIRHGTMDRATLWPADRWWERSGWEETAVFLVGLAGQAGHDPSDVIRWIEGANPEVAARCIRDSGATVPAATIRALRERWLPRLTDLTRDPQPEARAAIGRALGMLRLDGLPLDDRKGVGVIRGAGGDHVPDIDWLRVEKGPFIYQDGEQRTLPTFYISRYPVTFAQYRCFLEATDGFGDDRWWADLAWRPEAPAEQAWPYDNHPRERVSWFEATAFCRWLSSKLDCDVRLPSQLEWEKAARGTDGREYPWPNRSGEMPAITEPGANYVKEYANVDEILGNVGPHYLGMTSAVGIYPQGASPCGALDMAGNVWNWTSSLYSGWRTIERERRLRTIKRRDVILVGGGSWNVSHGLARTAYCGRNDPRLRSNDLGFRVVCASPS